MLVKDENILESIQCLHMKRRGLAFAFQDKGWKPFKYGVPDSEVKPVPRCSAGAEGRCISLEWDSAFHLSGI